MSYVKSIRFKLMLMVTIPLVVVVILSCAGLCTYFVMCQANAIEVLFLT